METSSLPQSYLEFLDAAVNYALNTAGNHSTHCPFISQELKLEIDHLIAVIRHAQSNTCESITTTLYNGFLMLLEDNLDWDCKTYYAAVGSRDGSNLRAEETLRRQFPPKDLTLCEPSVILDVVGQIVAYYLPGALLPKRTVHHILCH